MGRKSTNYMWYIFAAIVVFGVAFCIYKNGSPFSSTKVSRGKVASVRGMSASALKKKIASGDKFAVGVMSDGCGHCTAFKPAFFSAKKQLPNLKYFDATSSNDSKLFDKLGVKGFPSIVYVDGGKAVGEYSGNRKADDVVKKVGSFLNE